MLGHGLTCNVAPRLYFLSYIFGNVISPMLQRVEGDDANRIIELPGHKIVDDGFEVGRSISVSRSTVPLLKRSITR
jgi:hypothetical protein